MFRAGLAIAIVAVAVAGYWWALRPPGPYKRDNGGLYPIGVDGRYGFIDRTGRIAIKPQFDSTSGFSEGLAPVQFGGKWGYINSDGALAITPQFVSAFHFQHRRAVVRLGNAFGVIDMDGKYEISPSLRWVGNSAGEVTPVQTAAGVLAFVNSSGKVVLSGQFENFGEDGFSEELMAAASGGKWGFIDTAGKWVVEPQFESASAFAARLACVTIGGRKGYIDKTGRFAVNPQYDDCDHFHEGYAMVKSNGSWGFIDTKGVPVADAKFMATSHFSDGLAAVMVDNRWGFIDKAGKIVISPEFDRADSFQNGLARVAVLGKEAYVTTTGAFVTNPFPGTTVRAERARLEAEAVSAQVRASEAAERTNEDRRQMLANASKTIVGKWRNQECFWEFINGGAALATCDNGVVLTGTWSITADTYAFEEATRVQGGRPAPLGSRQTARIQRIDENSYELVDSRGVVWNGSRIK